MRRVFASAALTVTLGCFSEPSTAQPPADTEASGSSGETSTPDDTATPVGTSTIPSTPLGSSTDATSPTSGGTSLGGSSSDGSSGGEPTCGEDGTSCADDDVFCEDFADFDGDELPMPWIEAPGFSGIWSGQSPAFCDGVSLRTEVNDGNAHAILSAGVGVGEIDVTASHRFGGMLRLSDACLSNGEMVRAAVLQYVEGGSERAAIGLWIDAESFEVRQDPGGTTATKATIATDAWLPFRVHVDPGNVLLVELGEETLQAPIEDPPAGLDVRLLLGPFLGGTPFGDDCVELFDDVFFRAE